MNAHETRADACAAKLQERATSAALAIERCRSDCEWDLIPYYQGQRDAYLDALAEIQVRSIA